MERLALIAPLKPGTEAAAAELIASAPPFDLEHSGFDRHSVYLSAGEVVFVFEGHEVEWSIDALLDDPFNWMLADALERWNDVVAEPPRIARERFSWARPAKAEETVEPA